MLFRGKVSIADNTFINNRVFHIMTDLEIIILSELKKEPMNYGKLASHVYQLGIRVSSNELQATIQNLLDTNEIRQNTQGVYLVY